MIGIGVIGLGHWGPNHVRVFNQSPGARVVICAEPNEKRRGYIRNLYREVEVVADAQGVLRRRDVDAVVIATPTKTHYALTKAAIEAGKHILLEKPMSSTLEEAEDLITQSRKAGTILMHGHVFVYNRGIQFMKGGIGGGDFGKIQYLHAMRTNLGPIRCDVNVIQDLASHEFSIFDYLFGSLPQWVSATGSCPLGTTREDVAFLSMEYPEGILAHVLVSWLHPQKIRTLTLVGDKQMVTWDDTNPVEQVRIYDKGVMEEPFYDSFGEFHLRLRDADIRIPKVNLQEPLRAQAETFIRRIQDGTPTLSEGEAGLRVMKCLTAIQESLSHEGKRICLS